MHLTKSALSLITLFALTVMAGDLVRQTVETTQWHNEIFISEENINDAKNVLSAPPETEWNRTYGGPGDDLAKSVVQTSDGGYALAGWTAPLGSGEWDFWLVKTDASGNMQWNQTYGGTGRDEAWSVIQTLDGGYAITGYTSSFGVGGDFWLVKTDSNGNMQWNQTYGGLSRDLAKSVVQTSDGGYALAGYTDSFGVGGDFWLVKTDSNGNMQWNQTYGGTLEDGAWSVVQTVDEGYALAGYTDSYGAGDWDFWLVKTDASGNMQWNQTYGGTDWDEGTSLVQTVDEGYALAGYTLSFGAGSVDFWLVKTDASGNMQWNQTYGGALAEGAESAVQTVDGGYALAGFTYSFGAGGDFWLVKTDASGNMQWNKTYGGAGYEAAWSVVQTSDGGYAIAGETYSFGAGGEDGWLVKIARARGYNLNIHVKDWDLSDDIQGAYVYKDSEWKMSDENGWANWTDVSGTVAVKVKWFGVLVNGTFSVVMDGNKTIDVQCKIFDITVICIEGQQQAKLENVNVSAFFGENLIRWGITGREGKVNLINVPNNTLTLIEYDGNHNLIANHTRTVSSEGQEETIVCDKNYETSQMIWDIIEVWIHSSFAILPLIPILFMVSRITWFKHSSKQ